jgi:GT2 family glycosyltransferase
MKKISLLVSTVDSNFKENINFAKHIDFSICEVIVVQQMIQHDDRLKLDFDAKIVSVKEKGLAKSRNLALSLATCPIALICDDDVQFVKGFEQIILAAYERHPEAGLISFRIEDALGNSYKGYPASGHKHSFRSILRVNSIETSIQLNKIQQNKPYDERFGLGAACPTGEDTIFAVDTYNTGVSCYYVSKPIVIHPLESSGKTFSKEYPIYRGQVYRRAFSALGIPLGVLFALKKYTLYKKELGLLSFIVKFFKGYFSRIV